MRSRRIPFLLGNGFLRPSTLGRNDKGEEQRLENDICNYEFLIDNSPFMC